MIEVATWKRKKELYERVGKIESRKEKVKGI